MSLFFIQWQAFRILIFYTVHAIGILVAFVSYFYFRHPEFLDLSQWAGAVGIALWTMLNNPIFSRLIGYQIVKKYRKKCLESFNKFIFISTIFAMCIIFPSTLMLKDLFSRWSYVESIKEMTILDENESIPYATAIELANAYQIYPHRKEVPFILSRMSRLLAFDDEIENFNIFVKKFSQSIDIDKICERYKSKEDLEKYAGAIDPVIYLSRIIIESSPDEKGILSAISILKKYRFDDEMALLHMILYEHELLQINKQISDYNKKEKLYILKRKIEDLLTSTSLQDSPRKHLQVVTSHEFQEILDHYAQIEIEIAAIDKQFQHALISVPRLFSRILIMRQHIVRASETPWLYGPGKFSIYYFFQHYLGRESTTSSKIVVLFDLIPGLVNSIQMKLLNAEAFREYKSMKTWDLGTPLSAEYAGTEMHRKLVEWLKTGW